MVGDDNRPPTDPITPSVWNNVLRKTPLHDNHVRLNARMVPFAGWNMPIQYSGILAEIRSVRSTSGIFDVSHMGRFSVTGPEARELLNWVHTASIDKEMPIGRARYGLLCDEAGGIIDDAIVYRTDEDRFLLVANAGNAPTVWSWLESWRDKRFGHLELEDMTAQIAMIALQGPQAIDIISKISSFNRDEHRPFYLRSYKVEGEDVLVARTGYTGEDGVELMPNSSDSTPLWNLLQDAGSIPSGLGARDTLRLEAGLLLHGTDMDRSVNPIEAGLDRFLGDETAEFCGSAAIHQARQTGGRRKLVGFKTASRGLIPRTHTEILINNEVVGEVTSGGYSPTLDTNIGLGYVPVRLAFPGTRLEVDVRGKRIDVVTAPLPFYRRKR